MQSYTYAKVIDGKFNAQITGDTKDHNKVVKLIKNANCYCVEGTVTFYEYYDSPESQEPSIGYDFTKVTGLYTCNNKKKIK